MRGIVAPILNDTGFPQWFIDHCGAEGKDIKTGNRSMCGDTKKNVQKMARNLIKFRTASDDLIYNSWVELREGELFPPMGLKDALEHVLRT